jgi:hypothetical protein
VSQSFWAGNLAFAFVFNAAAPAGMAMQDVKRDFVIDDQIRIAGVCREIR